MQGSRLGGYLDHATPLSARPTVMAGGFVVCPMAVRPVGGPATGWMQEIYRMAYKQARAAIAPTWYDRAAAPSAN